MKKISGFTIIELMIALSVIAVAITIGVPSMTTLIQNNRQVSSVNQLVGFISLARSEAVSLSSAVSMCASSDGATCDTNNWELGGLMFKGSAVSGHTPNAVDILKIIEPQASGTTLRRRASSSTVPAGYNAGYLRYQANGRLSDADASSFVLCDDRGAPHARGVNINGIGQVRLARDSDNDGTVELIYDSALQEISCP
ncbi:GspH/FimT family pseudopilin [Aurantivibrio plasticivorans]